VSRKRQFRVADYLSHIPEAIDRIESYLEDIPDEHSFQVSPMAQDAVVRNLEIIGEAARNVQRQTLNLPHGIPTFRGS
jgi:uncharacterized protein with HEPN domain